MNKMALLIVDVQNLLINGHPYNETKVIKNIKELLLTARKNNKEVIYVRHDDGLGTELEKGSHNWKIFQEIEPKEDEKIIDKEYNSAFHKTNLKSYLDSNGIDTLILVGLQTEYCIDATCKSAFDLGYEVLMPEGTNTTFDNEFLSGEKLYKFYNYKIWNNRFAKIIPLAEAIKILQGI